jgi:hypothetical protein
MPTRPLDRLLFAQGGLCFFCKRTIPKADASVEHLVASANGGSNGDQNCVVCCKAMNALLGRMALKEKIQVVLNQKGQFKCPNKTDVLKSTVASAVVRPSSAGASISTTEQIGRIVDDLRKRASARPRTVKTLSSTISALFQKKLSEHNVLSLIERLRTDGVIVVSGTKVSYELPNKVV